MKGLIFTLLLTYGGALASLFNPVNGLLVYICFAIIRPESMWYWAVGGGNYSRIVAIALLVGWALHGFGNWQFGRARGIVAALILLWIWVPISAMLARNQNVAWGYFESQSKIFLPFLVGITTINSVARLKQLIWVIVLSLGYVGFELNMAYLGGFNRVLEDGFGGLDNNSVAIGMVTGFGMAFFLGLEAPGLWRKALAFGSAALMGHTILLSFSRGGMLALIITAVVGFLLIPKQPKHYVFFFLAILVALRFTGQEVQDRFGTVLTEDKRLADYSVTSRMDLWAALWKCMLNNPLGIGPGHWRLIAHEFGFPLGKDGHSTWLQIGAELGFVGLVSLLTFYFLCILRLLPLARGKKLGVDPWFEITARMVIAALVGFMISAQFVTLPGLETPYYIALVGAGALKLMSQPVTFQNEIVVEKQADPVFIPSF